MENRFQVNLKGIIALLSDNLYSGPRVFVRELLQNAVDAIHARGLADAGFTDGQIDIEVNDGEIPTVMVQDNGIGLSEEEVHQFLATIGESSKRNELGKARADFIGQFGIGLLSCFMVADEIVVITRSIRPETAAVEWRGRQNGTYTVRTVASDMAAGTRVYVRARADMRQWCSSERIRELTQFFGALLPVRLRMITAKGVTNVNSEPPAWRRDYESLEDAQGAMLDYGRRIFGADFLDVIPLQSTAGDVEGLAFVLPYSPSPAARNQHRVYLKNMLLSENAEGILPEWAFFVRCVVNANGLRPNAAREAFYEDATLEQARRQLGECLRNYLLELASHGSERLSRLVAIHYLAIKALAVHDDDFYRIFIDWIPFETSSGMMSLGEYRRQNRVVRYVPTVDQFRQVARVAASQQLCVINAGYTYSEQLLLRLSHVFPQAVVEEVSASTLAQSFGSLTIEEREQCFNLMRTADSALQPFRCATEVVKFQPEELTTLYHTSRD
ncbi:MAG TPA: HSP90 family protein, partial [Tepidisphaeraceae bacterium]|nr:HSP90 family protein [Tepidisphaeraceae bacterium]